MVESVCAYLCASPSHFSLYSPAVPRIGDRLAESPGGAHFRRIASTTACTDQRPRHAAIQGEKPGPAKHAPQPYR